MITGPTKRFPEGLVGARGEACFYCSGPVYDPAIAWTGTPTIFLHPSCCVDLCIRLLRDVHELECEKNVHVKLALAERRHGG